MPAGVAVAEPTAGHQPVGCQKSVSWSCRVVIFMDQAAEDITAAELLGDQRLRLA